MTVPIGSAAKVVTFGGFKRCASFRVAGVALCNTATSFIVSKVVLCDTRNTFARFSEDELHFVAGAALWRPPSSFCMAGAGSTLDAWRCVFFADRNVRAASNGDTVQIPWQIWQAWHFLRCDEN